MKSKTEPFNGNRYTWERRLPGGVSVFMLAELKRTVTESSSRICNAFWALDYTFHSHSQCRVGSRNNPWRNRLSNVAHLYPPGTAYWERGHKIKQQTHSAYICFWQGEDAGLGELLEGCGDYGKFEDPQGIIAQHLRRALDISGELSEDSFWQVQAVLFEILGVLFGAEHLEGETFRIETDKGSNNEGLEISRQVQGYLRRHLHEKVTLGALADKLKISRSSLTHRYGEETGEGPLTTHMKLRIDAVKHQLLRGEPLKAIAPRFGFTDMYHLSKAFKNVTGLSPRGFVQSLKG